MTGLTTPDRQREYLTIQEVAEELRCSEPTVRRRIRDGDLPAVRLGGAGSPVRIPRAGLTAWLWSEPTEES
jgi:excisionase family DNA binding protein